MGAAVDELMGMVSAPDRFAHSAADLHATQIAALNERFQERQSSIKLLARRAEEAGTGRIASLDDMVPLLFPHTAYKSYPESFLIEQKWDRLIKWLCTISPHEIVPIKTADISDIDDWIARLEANGNYISCSSGTTGKSAMLIASQQDMDWSRIDTVNVFAWGAGVEPAQDRRVMGLAPVAAVPKNRIIGEAQLAAFGDPARPRFSYPVSPITVGALTSMVVMRKKMADGTALPQEIAAFEATSQARAAEMAAAVDIAAAALIEVRTEKLMISGMWNSLYQVAKAVRDRGYAAQDFHPDNCIYVGGGLKRAQLPEDYQAFVHETFNIPEGRHFQNYSMQELNSGMPKCRDGGRYHVPPWIVPFILNQEGDALIPRDGNSEVTGRAAFFDLSLDGRWGGVISGDRVSLDYGPCACGNAGPSIRDDIARYADIQGDDKIGCAGTVDAYVRGLS
jgi:hypothetical protein